MAKITFKNRLKTFQNMSKNKKKFDKYVMSNSEHQKNIPKKS